MKSNRKEANSKRSSREDSKKPTQAANVKKASYSIQMNPSVSQPSKSLILRSHRSKNKVDAKVNYPMSSHHSRKFSVQQSARIEEKTYHQMIRKESTKKQSHARSNSTLGKKEQKDNKNCFKIDLSKLIGKEERQKQNKIILDAYHPHVLEEKTKQVMRNSFYFDFVIGKGGFGKVWQVEMKKSGKFYAMKQMNKTKIIVKKSIHSVLNERELLSKLKHPFIVNMSYSFQDREKLYLVMDLLVGGDLRYHMGCRRRFRETQAKFFIACILMGLEFLHLNNIIHRDIKPQNLVFDDKGYLRVTDLGIARIMKPNNSADTSGTPGYMAPEVMCRQDHSFPVDFYAVGIIAYELMMGRRPYNGRNRKQIRDQIISKQVQIKAEEVPLGWSKDGANFVNKMIQRKPCYRLGTEGGLNEIKEDPWFKGFPWLQLSKKSISSPFCPKNVLNSDDYRGQISETSQDENQHENKLLLREKNVQDLFEDYSYYCRDEPNKKNTKNSAATSNTFGSLVEDKQKTRGGKCIVNKFFRK